MSNRLHIICTIYILIHLQTKILGLPGEGVEYGGKVEGVRGVEVTGHVVHHREDAVVQRDQLLVH